MSVSNIRSISCELLDQGFNCVCIVTHFNQECLEICLVVSAVKMGGMKILHRHSSLLLSEVLLWSLDCCTSGKYCISDGDFVLLKQWFFARVPWNLMVLRASVRGSAQFNIKYKKHQLNSLKDEQWTKFFPSFRHSSRGMGAGQSAASQVSIDMFSDVF